MNSKINKASRHPSQNEGLIFEKSSNSANTIAPMALLDSPK